jgi:hypothetical protein
MELHRHLATVDDVYRTNKRALESMTLSKARVAARTSVLRIPVVVHVLYRTDEENLSVGQIQSQIDVLNRDFRMRNTDIGKVPAPFKPLAADAMIEFALAVRDPQGDATTGITRTRTTVASFSGQPQDLDLEVKLQSGARAWPADDYLNLWVCTLGGGLLGYAQFPGGPAATDGVVIGNAYFGTEGIVSPPFNLGRTATHEVGHWLNLLHIWGDDGGGCNRSDNVGDTPNQADSNPGKPTFPLISCSNAPHGDMFMNYMDYVDDDSMFLFTKGQVARMDATLRAARSKLAASQGLVPVTTPPLSIAAALPPSAAFRLPVVGETGAQPQEIFDGVDWVAG